MPKKLPKKEFDKIYSKVPRLCVDLVIKTPEGVVLTKRSIDPYKGFWHLPGGTILMNEKVEDAVKRVAKEEVNLEVGITKFLGLIEYANLREHGGVGYTIALAYLVYVEGGVVKADEGSSEVRVFKETPEKMIQEQLELLKNIIK